MFRTTESVKLTESDPTPSTCGIVVRVTLHRVTVVFDDGVQNSYKPERLERWKIGEDRYTR